LVIPKYQVEVFRLDNETVIITKINTLTGNTETYYKRGKKAKEIYEYIEGKGHYNKRGKQRDISSFGNRLLNNRKHILFF
jgi:hypothetical protein